MENLLDLSRLQAGAAAPTPELWPVDELVAQALEELGDRAERVDVTLPADLPPVQVDPIQSERVLVNLLENAAQVLRPRTRCRVRVNATRRERDRARHRPRAGHPGRRAGAHLRAVPPRRRPAERRGAGLGLAIARGFAEANGGRVWAESRPEQGASFALALPAERDRVP